MHWCFLCSENYTYFYGCLLFFKVGNMILLNKKKYKQNWSSDNIIILARTPDYVRVVIKPTHCMKTSFTLSENRMRGPESTFEHHTR